MTSQIITFEHEGNWSKALEYYDLQVRSKTMVPDDICSRTVLAESLPSTAHPSSSAFDNVTRLGPYKGIIRSLQKTGCSHVLDLYYQGLTSRRGQFQCDEELYELQVQLIHFLQWKDSFFVIYIHLSWICPFALIFGQLEKAY